jgi:hypothetical protein
VISHVSVELKTNISGIYSVFTIKVNPDDGDGEDAETSVFKLSVT